MSFQNTNTQRAGVDIAQASNQVAETAQQLGISSEQLRALTALMSWKLFLALSQSPDDDSEGVQDYLDTYWFMSDRWLVANAIRGRGVPDEVVEQLLYDIWEWAVKSEDFCNEAPEALKTRYPQLSPSKIKLLQQFIERESLLDNLDVRNLSSQFPFSISKMNFFGRFIGGIEWNPQNAIRHLRTATPFFIQMKALIEALYNDKRNFLQISSLSRDVKMVKKTDNDGKVTEVQESYDMQDRREAIQKDFQWVVQACIEKAWDMLDDPELQQLRCIALPPLPYLNILETWHIEQKEQWRLAIEIMRWIFFGERDGELLNRSGYSIEDKKKLKKLELRIPQIRKKIRELKKKLDRAYKNHEAVISDWKDGLRTQNTCESIEKDISFERASLEELVRERRDLKSSDGPTLSPIIKELESRNYYLSQLKKFRKQVTQARERWEAIVFTTFDSDSMSVFAQYFDRAFAQRHSDTSGLGDIFSNCRFLMSDRFAEYIRGAKAGAWSATRSHMRSFAFDQSVLNQSARYVVQELLPQKEDIQASQVIDYLVGAMTTPWVTLKAHLKYLVQQYCGKKTPNIDDYLVYTFENLVSTEKTTILWLLDLLRQIGHDSIPQRCKDIASERFHISPEIMNQFEVYVSHYKPDTLWKLPEVFQDRATLETYLKLWLDAYCMDTELQRLQALLSQGRWVVWVIDTTEYHPELSRDGEKSDVEKSNEVWGNYVRPTERLVRALAGQLIEGNVHDSLRHHSLISVRPPSDDQKSMAKILKIFFGIDMDVSTDLSKMAQVISELHNYDENTILIVNAESVKDFESYKELLSLFERFRFKVIVQLKESLPGIPQLILKPFLDSEILQRIMHEEPSIRRKLGLQEPIQQEIVSFAITQVKRMRSPSDDPLNLTLQIINGAAQNARMQWFGEITYQDITAAIVPIFHLPDSEQMRSRIQAVENFTSTAPLEVLWQSHAIEQITRKMKSHILWLRDPSRPLSLLLPGPTWVGKTELMIKLAQAVNMPFFQIEWAEFSEQHTVSRLVWSPTWYKWPDKWILFKFLEDNNSGIVFIDEIEKMHPAVYTALMNFFDKATLTAWDGTIVRRPWFIIVGASNAGADDLKSDMSIREVKEVLSRAFVDQFGNPRPELVRRFDPVVMLAIEKSEFQKVLVSSIESIWNRFWLVNSNAKLVSVDDDAVDLLYNEACDVCKFSRSMWFGFDTRATSWQVDVSSETFYDMRHISRALDNLVWDGLARLVQEQIMSWRSQDRKAITEFWLVWDKDNNKIHIVLLPKDSQSV